MLETPWHPWHPMAKAHTGEVSGRTEDLRTLRAGGSLFRERGELAGELAGPGGWRDGGGRGG